MKKKEKKISLYGRWKNRAKSEKKQSWWQKAWVALTWWLKGNGVVCLLISAQQSFERQAPEMDDREQRGRPVVSVNSHG